MTLTGLVCWVMPKEAFIDSIIFLSNDRLGFIQNTMKVLLSVWRIPLISICMLFSLCDSWLSRRSSNWCQNACWLGSSDSQAPRNNVRQIGSHGGTLCRILCVSDQSWHIARWVGNYQSALFSQRSDSWTCSSQANSLALHTRWNISCLPLIQFWARELFWNVWTGLCIPTRQAEAIRLYGSMSDMLSHFPNGICPIWNFAWGSR